MAMEAANDNSIQKGIVQEKIDLLGYMEKFIAIKKSKNQLSSLPIYNGSADNEASTGKLFSRLLINFLDHILFHMQFTDSSNILSEFVETMRTKESRIEDFLHEKGFDKRNSKTMKKFLEQWLIWLDCTELLMMKNLLTAVYVCMGKSIQRLTKTYLFSVKNLVLPAEWYHLSNHQIDDFTKTMGRLIVRTLMLANEKVLNASTASTASSHNRLFLCLQTTENAPTVFGETDMQLPMQYNLWETFRLLANDCFNPYPKVKPVKRIHLVRSKVSRKTKKEADSRDYEQDTGISPSVAKSGYLNQESLVSGEREGEKGNEEDENNAVENFRQQELNVIAIQFAVDDVEQSDGSKSWLVPMKGVKHPR